MESPTTLKPTDTEGDTNIATDPAMAQKLKAKRVLCVYENQSLTTDSTFAVARLTSQLLETLAVENPRTEVVAASPVDGKLQGVRNVVTIPGPKARIRRQLMNNRLTRSVGINGGIRSTVPYQRAEMAMKEFAGTADEKTVVICLTFTATVLAKRILPKARVVFWIRSLPRMGQEMATLEAVNAADAVATPSRAIYKDLFEILCRNRFTPPVWVIPNSIDDDQFCTISAEQQAAVRARMGLSEEDLAIIHVGRAPEKGLQIVETALSLCQTQSRNLVLISVGGKEKSRRRVTPFAEVLETGRVQPQELNEIYQICDLGVVPSVWWENCPLSLIEMMSHGRCTIGSRVGGIPEMIQHGETGLLVDEPNDVVSWARAMDSVISDDEYRRRLGREASNLVAGRFSRSQFMEKWETLLNTVVAKP